MSKYTRNQAILSKIETTYGSDPTPTLANGLLIGVPTFSVNGREVTRDFLRATFSQQGSIVGEKTCNVKFPTELKGSGVVGQIPQFAPNLRAAGLRQENILAFLFNSLAGVFTVGEIVTGGTSSCVCVVEAKTATHLFLDVGQIDLTVTSSANFAVGEIVTDGTSAATGKIIQIPDATSIVLSQVSGTFGVHTVTGGSTGTSTAASVVTALDPPVEDETLTGASSGATCDSNYDSIVACSLTVDDSSGFEIGETLTGNDSGANAAIVYIPDGTTIYVGTVSDGPFTTDDDAAEGGTSGATCAISSVDATGFNVYQPGWMWEPRSKDFESCTQYFFADDIRFRMLGCRGNADMDFSVGGYPILNLDMTSKYTAPTDTAIGGTLTVDENAAPQVLGVDLQIGDFATPVAERLTIDYANNVAQKRSMRESDGIKAINVTGRNSAGSIDPDVESLSTFNPWTTWDASTKVCIFADVGSSYGNRVLVFANESQFKNPTFADKDGVMAYNIPFMPTGSDNEVKLFIY